MRGKGERAKRKMLLLFVIGFWIFSSEVGSLKRLKFFFKIFCDQFMILFYYIGTVYIINNFVRIKRSIVVRYIYREKIKNVVDDDLVCLGLSCSLSLVFF